MAGRFRDPLIGRDVLVGVLAGLAVVSSRLDWAGILAGPLAANSNLGTTTPWQMAYVFFMGAGMCMFLSAGFLFILCLFQALARSTWLASLLLSLLFAAVGLLGGNDALTGFLKTVSFAAIIIFVLLRFGLVSSAALLFTYVVLGHVTLTLDWSVWYAGPSFAVLGFFAALMVAAFYTSLGGKPLLGRALLDE